LRTNFICLGKKGAGVSSPRAGDSSPHPSVAALPAVSRRAATRAGRRDSARLKGRRRRGILPHAGGAGWAQPPRAVGAVRRRGPPFAPAGGGPAGSGIAMAGSGVPRRSDFLWWSDGCRSGGSDGRPWVVRHWHDLLGVLSGRRLAGTSLAGGGSPCGGLDGQWAVPCSGGPFASLFIEAVACGAASAVTLWSAADSGVRRPPASGGQAWGREGGGGLLGSAGSRPASR
jgi:hypothetical protein